MAKKVVKLKIDKEQEENFLVLGLTSSQSDFKLIWGFNKDLSLHFQRCNDLTFMIKDILQSFIHYHYEDDISGVSYDFIGNSSEQGYLLKSFNNFDYILRIKGLKKEKADELKKQIQGFSSVTFVSFVLLSDIKEIERLYF